MASHLACSAGYEHRITLNLMHEVHILAMSIKAPTQRLHIFLAQYLYTLTSLFLDNKLLYHCFCMNFD